MIELLPFVVPFAVGGALGAYFGRRPLRNPRRALRNLLLVVIGAVLLALAILGAGETLAWVLALSVMVILAVAPLLGLGFWLGWFLARRPRPGATVPPRADDPQPIGPSPRDTPSASRGSASLDTVADRAISRVKRNPFAVLAAAGIPAAFWVMIGVGFWIQNGMMPPEVRVGFPFAVVVLIAALVIAVRYVWTHREDFVPSFPSIDISLWPSKDLARQRAWVASMAADPRRKRYADLIAAGEFWTPEGVEYDLDPQATACCAHLAPVESALRKTGIKVELLHDGVVRAGCLIDAAALARQFVLAEGVNYHTMHIPDRSIHDPPDARVLCPSCNSVIWVVHPEVAPAGTPVFPDN